MKTRIRKILLISAVAAAMLGVAGYASLQKYLATPLQLPAEKNVFTVERGDPFSLVANRMAADGWLAAPALLSIYARATGLAGRIQAGEYILKLGQSPGDLLKMLVAGRVRLHSLTIVEGWTIRDLLAALRQHPVLVQTLEIDDATEINAVLELDYPHPEGLFFPDTYRFARGTTDVDLLRQAHALMLKNLQQVWQERIPIPVLDNAYQGLILASIVERETALDQERPQIAGVFIRRLEKGMRLQTDPTVIYGLGERFDGNLTRRDLRTDTPYNTYMRNGLPPTPIALPGLRSLQAVARPADGTALYFVATGRSDGSHTFTDTLEAHNAAVASYLAMLKQKK